MLPQPSDDFVWVQAAPGPALVCRALPAGGRHLFTTRPWQLGADRTNSTEAWAEVAAAIGVAAGDLARMHQVHGATVFVATQNKIAERPHADIAIASDRGLAVAVQAADCVPLLVADRRRGVIAAAHAGWRGLAQRVPRATVLALAERFGTAPGDLIAAVGPSIGACCYEVGPDVRESFARAGYDGATLARWFHDAPQPTAVNPSMPTLSADRTADRWFLDCWAVARDQLREAGVDEIHVARLCTASHSDLLCSYRRDGKGAGRIAAAIVIT